LQENYPHLYNQIVTKAVEGRFIGVGGAWVEMDGNIPSGESFIRQLLYGQQVFRNTF
jgi:alpha-mannosidase